MTSSLVGSEMCIRDSPNTIFADGVQKEKDREKANNRSQDHQGVFRARCIPVSYTHLTLPTICSV
eukprot:6596297-Prorocentrum_lima.AAC.1